jgi:serine kinase
MASKYSVPGKGGIKLVKKNESWIPQRERRKTTLEVHGYTISRNLGEGAFAKVKLAKSKKHNRNVAIKIIDKRKAPKDYISKFLPREIHIMHRLNHPNVVSIKISCSKWCVVDSIASLISLSLI